VKRERNAAAWMWLRSNVDFYHHESAVWIGCAATVAAAALSSGSIRRKQQQQQGVASCNTGWDAEGGWCRTRRRRKVQNVEQNLVHRGPTSEKLKYGKPTDDMLKKAGKWF